MDHRVLILVLSWWTSESFDLRLVRGASRCHGELQLRQEAEDWKPMRGEDWTLKFGSRVCSELDCGSAVSVERIRRSTQTPLWWIHHNCDHASLDRCFTTTPNAFTVLKLDCSDSIRLVNGSSLCSGRLEVRSSQSWSSVCEGNLGLLDAQVVCRELGCGAPSLLQGAPYGEAGAPLLKKFRCEGHESALLECRSSVSDTCSSGKAVELTCSAGGSSSAGSWCGSGLHPVQCLSVVVMPLDSDPDDVRLVGGVSNCAGTVQVKHYEDWRYLGIDYLFWTLKAAAVLCRRLDCGSPVSLTTGQRPRHPVWEIVPFFLHSTSALRDCVTGDDGASFDTLVLTCSDSIRLVHGSSLCSGRLEVRSNQSWSSVCEEDLDLNDAQVVCRELDCGAPLLLQGGLYGEGEAPVWTSELQCEGHESAVLDCRRSSSSGKTCSPGTAAGLTCTGGVQLEGQPSRCAGTLEIQHQGTWRPVDNPYKDWDLKTGSAVCQSLDCGSAVSVTTKNNISSRPVWRVRDRCLKLTSGLKDCVEMNHDLQTSFGVELACADLLPQPNISLSDGVFGVYQQGFRVLLGSDFTITCSVQPQYPGGSFQLIADTKEPINRTLPAVNHSAHFPLSAMGHAHQGNYACVYHMDVFNQTFTSSQSPALYLTVGAAVHDLIIRVLVIVLGLLIYDILLLFYFMVSKRRNRSRGNRQKTRHGPKTRT